MKRVDYLDIARGISIVLMVIGHLSSNNIINNIIYSFHMPLFIIISGYFFKNNKKIYKLFFFYLIVIFIKVITMPTNILFRLKFFLFSISLSINDTINGISLFSVATMWFVPFLIAVKLIFGINTKICKENYRKLFILCIIESTIGYLLSKFKIWLVWNLDIALYSIIWFYIGYIIHKNNLLQTIINNKIVIAICFLIWLIGAQFVDVGIASRRYINSYMFLLPILIATTGVFSVIWISKKLENVSIFLKKCGEKSMYFLATYYLTTSYINAFISNDNTKILVEIIVSFLGAIIIDKILLLLKKMFNYLSQYIHNKNLSLQK